MTYSRCVDSNMELGTADTVTCVCGRHHTLAGAFVCVCVCMLHSNISHTVYSRVEDKYFLIRGAQDMFCFVHNGCWPVGGCTIFAPAERME